jgi:N-sulfoglucosamine sulfohydrolase
VNQSLPTYRTRFANMKTTRLLLILFLCAFASLRESKSEPQHNVLWLYLEDVSRWFSCYGDIIIDTPNIDALAADGIRFDRFYTPAGVCSATRSSQLLGVMQTTFGIHNHRSSRNNAPAGSKHDGIGMIHLPQGVKTLPQIFKDDGFYTFNQSGKDDYNFVFSMDDLYSPNSTQNWWRDRPDNKPFFGQIQLKGGKLGGQAPENVDRGVVNVPPYYPDIPEVREEIAHHYDCILETDRQVGEIVAALKEDGLYDKTFIFLHSDHGYKLHRDKQFLYEGGIKMPLIVTGPGIDPGQVREDLISGIDLAPTSLSVGGLPVPDWMEGHNFLAPDYTPREYLIAARDRCDYTIERIRAVVTPDFKYLKNYLTDRPFMQPSYKDPWPVSIKFREMMANGEMNEEQLTFFGPEKPAEELYDLGRDPHEINNLANDPAYAETLAKHRDILETWVAETGGGIEPESDEGLIQALYRWSAKAVNPEYDKVRDQLVPVPTKKEKKKKS